MIDSLSKKIIRNIILQNLEGKEPTIIIWTIPPLMRLLKTQTINIAILLNDEISEVLFIEQQINAELRKALNQDVSAVIFNKLDFSDRLAESYPPELFILEFGEIIVGSIPKMEIRVSENALIEYLDRGFISFGMMLNDMIRGNIPFAKENALYSIYYAITAVSLKSTGMLIKDLGAINKILETIGKKQYFKIIGNVEQIANYTGLGKRENTIIDLLLDDASRNIIISSYIALKLAWEYINKTKIANLEKLIEKLSPIMNNYEISLEARGTLPIPIIRAKTPEREYAIELRY